MRIIRREWTILQRIQQQLDCGLYWRFMRGRCIGQLVTLSQRRYKKVKSTVPLFAFQRRARRRKAVPGVRLLERLYGKGKRI